MAENPWSHKKKDVEKIMGSNERTFEVKVNVKRNGSNHYSYHVGAYIENEVTKMYHILARTHYQAMEKAKKYGRPISVRKVDIDNIRPSENLQKLIEPYGAKNPYPDAIAMDEFIWKKKADRSERIENRRKDKNKD